MFIFNGWYCLMTLREGIESLGNWLFRRRSYAPLVLFPVLFYGFTPYGRSPGSAALAENWELVCLAVGLFGLAIRCLAVGYAAQGTSGRSTRCPRADDLNTTGMYSLIRHPLYVGNYFMWLSAAMLPGSIPIAIFVSIAFWLYYAPIMFAEEAFLTRTFGTRYTEWAGRTPAIIPTRISWVRPSRPFAVRSVFKRERSGVAGLLLTLGALGGVEDSLATNAVRFDAVDGSLLAAGLMTALMSIAYKGIKRHRSAQRI